MFDGRLRIGLLAAVLGLAACVSDALPRDEPPDASARADSGGKEGGASDSARGDTQDADVANDGNDASGGSADANDSGAIDASEDPLGDDASDATRDTLGGDASDAAPAVDVRDTATGIDTMDAGTNADVNDAGPAIDATDSSAPVDANDSGSGADASSDDTSDDGDASSGDASSGDAADGGGANDADARVDVNVDAGPDGGVVIFYEENFDSGLGTFSSAVNVCGSPPVWSNNTGYAHASEPAATGVSRISSPVITVPPNTSNVTLRMSHRFAMDDGYDCGQLLVSVNGATTATQVTTFTSGGYTTGGSTNPANCALAAQSQYQGWSGTHAESVSEVNLSAAPFNVVAGNTVTVSFRMTTDIIVGGTGWDINWVTLSANSP